MEVKEIWIAFNEEIRQYVLRKVADEQMANDVVQDVFEKVIKNIQKLNEVENIQQYLYKMARNAVVDSFRSRKVKFEELDNNKFDNQEVLEEESDSESLNSIISKCCILPFINKLPEKYREALLASEINNISQTELAAHLKISYSGAKSRVQRGRDKLKEILQECCNFEYDSFGNLIQNNSDNCSC